MLLALAALFAFQSFWDDPNPTGRWAAPTRSLAVELLPADWVSDAVSHVVSRGISLDGPPSSVRFEGRPSETGDGFCARKWYYVSVSAEGEPQEPVVGNKVRLGRCEGLYAHINPGSTLAESKKVLRWLDWARKQARRDGPLPFTLKCRDEVGQGKCDKGARSALAALSIEKASIITRRSVSVVETTPGELYWSVESNDTPGHAFVDLTWKIPAPF